MEGSTSIKRNRTRPLQHSDEVGGPGGSGPPYEHAFLKVAQAVITQTPNGEWKITIQSDKQVESALIGTLENVINELKFVATRDWHKRSIY
jgi:hypothetical protein